VSCLSIKNPSFLGLQPIELFFFSFSSLHTLHTHYDPIMGKCSVKARVGKRAILKHKNKVFATRKFKTSGNKFTGVRVHNLLGLPVDTSVKEGQRGTDSHRSETLWHRQGGNATGKIQQGSIRFLRQKSPAGFGNKTSDGGVSQTSSNARSRYGYRGDLTPIVDLMNEAGHKNLVSASSYVASADMAPTVHRYQSTNGPNGLQPIFPDSTSRRQEGWQQLLPPRQATMDRKEASFPTGKLEALDAKISASLRVDDRLDHIGGPVVIDPLTQHTISDQKLPRDDPNPIYPLEPTNPVDQQGYMPTRIPPGETWAPPEELSFGNILIKSSENLPEEMGYVNVEEAPDGMMATDEAMTRAAVENYLWSRANNISLRGAYGAAE